MAKTNTAARSTRIKTHEGGAAKQINPVQQLARSVMSCLLWEGEFYEDGESIRSGRAGSFLVYRHWLEREAFYLGTVGRHGANMNVNNPVLIKGMDFTIDSLTLWRNQ